MSTLMFNRSVQVNIINEAYALQAKDIRIDFDITLTSESEPNHATAILYNLSEQSRTDLVETLNKGIRKVQIFGGYSGFTSVSMDSLLGFVPGDMLFYGDLISVKNKKINTGWTTEIEALDGYAELKALLYTKNWPAGTPIQTIILDICASIGLPFDPGFTPIVDVLKKATSYHDPVSKVLNKLAKAFNFTWSIKHGILELCDKDMPLLSALAQVVTLSPDTGLIGSPDIMMDDDPQTDSNVGSITAVSLLNGKLMPRRPVMILPTNPMTFAGIHLTKTKKLTGFNVGAKGVYIIDSVRHFGSNRSGQFHSEITCPIWQ